MTPEDEVRKDVEDGGFGLAEPPASSPDERTERLGELVREAMRGSGPFKPVAYYIRELDRLTVIVKDCSVTENWTGGELDILTDTHTDELVGFSINQVTRVCRWLEKTVGTATVEEMLLETVRQKQSKLTAWQDRCLALVRQLTYPHVTVH